MFLEGYTMTGWKKKNVNLLCVKAAGERMK